MTIYKIELTEAQAKQLIAALGIAAGALDFSGQDDASKEIGMLFSFIDEQLFAQDFKKR